VRIGIFSDVHGNVEALEVVLKALEEERVNRSFCLGDLVGYGPNPNRCVEKVMQFSDRVVAGNHDHAATGQTPTTYFNEYARMAIDWTRKVLSSNSMINLNRLPVVLIEGEITLVHATPDKPEAWHYIFTYADARRSFGVLKTPLCFVGHSHAPGAFVRNEEGEIFTHNPTEITLEEGKTYIINVGSVGQPRDGDPRASYGILDTEERRFQLKRLTYPVEVVQEKMWRENLPPALIDRLSFGQ